MDRLAPLKAWLARVNRQITKPGVLWAVALLGLALWALLGLDYYAQRAEEERKAVAALRQLTTTLAEETEHALEIADQIAWNVRRDVQLNRPIEDLNTYLNPRLMPGDMIVSIALLDRDGWLVNSSLPFARAYMGDRDHFRVLVNQDSDTPYVSKPLVDRNSKQFVIQLSRRLEDSKGHFAGGGVLSLNPAYFANCFAQYDLGPGTVALLFGQDGTVRAARADKLMNSGDNISKLAPAGQFRGFPMGEVNAAGKDDGALLLSYRAMRNHPLIVALGNTRAQLYADALAAHAWLYLIGGGLLSMLPLLCLLALRRMRARNQRLLHILRESVRENRRARRQMHELFGAATAELQSKLEAHRALIYSAHNGQPSLDAFQHMADTISMSTDGLIDLLRTQRRLLDLLFLGSKRFDKGSTMSVAVLARGMLRQQTSAREVGLDLDAELEHLVCYTDLILLKDIFYASLLALLTGSVFGDRIEVVRYEGTRVQFRLLGSLPPGSGAGAGQRREYSVPTLSRAADSLDFAARLAEKLGATLQINDAYTLELEMAGLLYADSAAPGAEPQTHDREALPSAAGQQPERQIPPPGLPAPGANGAAARGLPQLQNETRG
ncbi:MAG: hypothetical protein MO847_05925 [Candidatus Protistobacter heckmanni]|nr:hypothetical protein [Candidatus Protistobacter heckmanni]